MSTIKNRMINLLDSWIKGPIEEQMTEDERYNWLQSEENRGDLWQKRGYISL
jgi:hypothetical protein